MQKKKTLSESHNNLCDYDKLSFDSIFQVDSFAESEIWRIIRINIYTKQGEINIHLVTKERKKICKNYRLKTQKVIF